MVFIQQRGLVHVAYAQGDVPAPQGSKGSFNWTRLQSILKWSLVDVQPSVISLSGLQGAESNAPGLTLTVNVKQSAPSKENQPLTICATHTILGYGDPSIRVLMRHDSSKHLLGDPLPGVHMRYREPESDDWKTELPFVTIPPGNEGLTVTKTILAEQLLHCRGKDLPPDRLPQAGDEYSLAFASGRNEPFIKWWNWGDLEGDLKERKLVDLVDPKLNGVENPEPPEPPTLLPFEAWGEECDDDGNTFVRLFNVLDTTPLRVKFTE